MKNIAIFGTGSALRDLLSVLPGDVHILALGDNNAALHGQAVLGHKVVAPEALAALPFDLCIIAARAVDPIREQLTALGVRPQRIAAYYPSYSDTLATSIGADTARINACLGLALPLPGIATMYMWPDSTPALPAGGPADFVRRHAIKLAAEMVEARGVAGAIAELGVYQGETAAFLNRLFAGRDLHLFDTFEGFAGADVARDTADGYSQAHAGDFRDTDAQRVLARMETPANVHIHKGFFPDTAQGIEARFAFVSLDVDLYAPTLAGLHWFYERLNPGGYIFIHDYNNARYNGVRGALDAFLAQVPAVVVPLPDFAGSVVIGK
ncbi:MAG TPA: TylF/MycF/NovP-related O-methyltransferase [Novosphingobium sp.]|nr:TylF/MycF/NovP-related O-methyltransferase [Novosphingobium sp.]